jgi:hypothetical protein
LFGNRPIGEWFFLGKKFFWEKNKIRKLGKGREKKPVSGGKKDRKRGQKALMCRGSAPGGPLVRENNRGRAARVFRLFLVKQQYLIFEYFFT